MKRFIALLLICVMSFGILSVSAEEPETTEVAAESYAEEIKAAGLDVEAEEESEEAAVLTAEEETEEEVSEVTDPEVTESEVTEPEVTEPAAETEEETTQSQEQEEETTAPEEAIPTEPAQEETSIPEEQDLSIEETEGALKTEETAEETPDETESEETLEVLSTYEDGWNTDDNGNTIYVVNGEPVRHTWKKIDGSWYYFGWNGAMYTNTSIEVDGYWYRVDENGCMVTGWYEDNWGYRYYYKSTGAAANGTYTVNGTRYYFDIDGCLHRNASTVYTDADGAEYIIRTDYNGVVTMEVKVKENGWTKIGDDWYYFEDGIPALGWKTIDGKQYCFDDNGRMYRNETAVIYTSDSSPDTYECYYFDNDGQYQTGWFRHADDTTTWYHAGADGILSEGFEKIGSYTYFFEWGGRMIADRTYSASGSAPENSNHYYFNKSGHMQTGWFRKDGDSSWYHAKTNGVLSSGWEKISGYWYYFEASVGRMFCDQGVYTEDGYYRVDADGHMLTGWYDSGMNWFYYLSSGKAADGITRIGSSTYYFLSDGSLQYNTTVIKNNVLYKIDENGKVTSSKKAADINGWYKDGENYYYSADGTFVAGQLKKIGTKWYGFDGNGIMIRDTIYYINDCFHGFDKNGYMITGWNKDHNGNYYYFDSEGKAYQGLKTIGSKKYYFSPAMRVSMKWTENGNLYVADKEGYVTVYSGADGWVNDRYYVENGKLVKEGWKKIDGSWYYFENGEAKCDTTATVNGKMYHFNTSKAMDTGWIRDINYSTNWSYADASGALVTDSWKKIGTKKYYFNSSAYASTGMEWLYDESGNNYNLYLFNSDGSLKKQITETEKWIKNDKDWFYIDSNGNYATGDREIDGKVYGFNFSNGALYTDRQGYSSGGIKMKSAWYEYQPGIYWYYDENGNVVHNKWKKIGGKWYYFNGSRMATGDLLINGKLYHFSDSGVWDGKTANYKNGWNLIKGRYYYYDSTNGLAKGLKTINGRTYFFEPNGAMAVNGLQYVYGNYYVFNSNGTMLKKAWYNQGGNTWIYADADGKAVTGLQTIGGKQYYFGNNGYESFYLATHNTLSFDRKTFYAINDEGVVVKTYTANGTGWKKTEEDTWLYSEKGAFVRGYQKIGGDFYYFSYNGTMMANYYDPGYGFFGSDGKLQKEKNWIKDGNEWYYFTGESYGSMYGSHFIDGKWYYFSINASKGVKYADGAVYDYAGSAGGRTKLNWTDGWNTYNGKKYYVENGRLVNGLRKIGSSYYYFQDGEMATGGRLVSTGYGDMYLNADGSFVKNGWKKIDDVWCYFDGTGYMLRGAWIIDGKTYHLRHPNYYYGVD